MLMQYCLCVMDVSLMILNIYIICITHQMRCKIKMQSSNSMYVIINYKQILLIIQYKFRW